MTSFFRYPGGKSKLYSPIEKKLLRFGTPKLYAEPFFGGGSIGIKLLTNYSKIESIYINDKNNFIFYLWEAVISHPEILKKLILDYVPSVDSFYEIKQQLLNAEKNINIHNQITYGFLQLVIHQISYSGLGVMSGGPLGGKKQKSKYKINCRWSTKYICKKIDKIYNLFKKHNYKIYNEDFNNFITKIDSPELMMYIDPPYYEKGNQLYQYGFTKNDHIRLSHCLKNTKSNWVLSYDDCSEIKKLYNWANIEKISINYSINTARKKSELLITK